MNRPVGEDVEQLRAALDDTCRRAAELLARADVLLLMTGAGFSADSGLAVYADVACVDAYKERGLTYMDVCNPEWLQAEKALFWGFWGQCFNDYRRTAPHDGYRILEHWVEARFRRSEAAESVRTRLESLRAPAVSTTGSAYEVSDSAGAFFAFTSNVDAHHYDWFRPHEVYECHGNTETYQCSGSDCMDVFRAPREFAFKVDTATMLAPEGEAATAEEVEVLRKTEAAPGGEKPVVGRVGGGGRPHRLRHFPLPSEEDEAATSKAFAGNHPVCPACGKDARPAILMFGDVKYIWDEAAEQRFCRWKEAVLAEAQKRPHPEPLKVVILEIGAGKNVPTVRYSSEGFLDSLLAKGADAHLVRMNRDQPLADRFVSEDGSERVLSVMERGLAALRRIDAHMPEEMRSAELTVAPETPSREEMPAAELTVASERTPQELLGAEE